MPRFKVVDYSPRLLPVDLSCQLLPGTFEFGLHHLLQHEIDLSEIEARYRNDEVGASAYEPRIFLTKVNPLLGPPRRRAHVIYCRVRHFTCVLPSNVAAAHRLRSTERWGRAALVSIPL
jgi:hypothetical protein